MKCYIMGLSIDGPVYIHEYSVSEDFHTNRVTNMYKNMMLAICPHEFAPVVYLIVTKFEHFYNGDLCHCGRINCDTDQKIQRMASRMAELKVPCITADQMQVDEQLSASK